jgi:hypothetical protein
MTPQEQNTSASQGASYQGGAQQAGANPQSKENAKPGSQQYGVQGDKKSSTGKPEDKNADKSGCGTC